MGRAAVEHATSLSSRRYDALIAEVAFRAGARSLLTLNRQHFERLAPEGLEIVEP